MRKIVFRTKDQVEIGELTYDPKDSILNGRIAGLKLHHPHREEVNFDGFIMNDVLYMTGKDLLSFLDHLGEMAGKIIFSGVDTNKWKLVNIVFVLSKWPDDSYIFVIEDDDPDNIEALENVESWCSKFTFRIIDIEMPVEE